MTVKVKDLKLDKRGKERTIRATIEDVETKKEYAFSLDPETVMDEETFKQILNMWDGEIIPREKARAKLKDSEIEKTLKKRIGIEIKKV